ncbi:cytochrome c [Methylophilus sp.]|jgi:cytochrome c-L|uniref:c-type cytochrome n=1 Tax=Methylophilus sp. TaxID=29541 RepID=UPI0011DB660F|nr:cytochrome c [Methylophilus sp.]TXI44376.1 MAG: c-type cytochrome [Methylophilus sp.]
MLGNTFKSALLISLMAFATGAMADITFSATQDGSTINIDKAMFDTDASKEFLATGKNPYIGNEEAIKKGKKIFNLYSCVACHGGKGEGAVGPGLIGANFRYAKNATNKGMFETIWHGTNGGMGAKGFGLMAPDDGIKPDELLKVIAFIRSNSNVGTTGNE